MTIDRQSLLSFAVLAFCTAMLLWMGLAHTTH